MLSLPVIPYLLGFVLPNSGPRITTADYTFNVRIDTLIFIRGKPHHKDNVGVSFLLICSPKKYENLECYINRKSIHYGPSNETKYMLPYESHYNPSVFDYASIPFNLAFDARGPYNCGIEQRRVKNKKTLIAMYRFIANQLNIGVEIKNGRNFVETERSVLGMCPTHYEISRHNNRRITNYTLYSYIEEDYFNLTDIERLEINKYRFVVDCELKKYILGSELWNDYVPIDNLFEWQSSKSRMSFAKHNFRSRTVNIYGMYHKINEIKIGYIREKINMVLMSVKI